jgi:hypothetical protein
MDYVSTAFHQNPLASLDSIGYGSDRAFVIAIVIGLVNFTLAIDTIDKSQRTITNTNKIDKTVARFILKS